jgi:hypothetical protein
MLARYDVKQTRSIGGIKVCSKKIRYVGTELKGKIFQDKCGPEMYVVSIKNRKGVGWRKGGKCFYIYISVKYSNRNVATNDDI